jgi:hypothetical protein
MQNWVAFLIYGYFTKHCKLYIFSYKYIKYSYFAFRLWAPEMSPPRGRGTIIKKKPNWDNRKYRNFENCGQIETMEKLQKN